MMPVVVASDELKPPPAVAIPADFIEIALPQGYRVRVVRNFKAASLRVVLDAVEQR